MMSMWLTEDFQGLGLETSHAHIPWKNLHSSNYLYVDIFRVIHSELRREECVEQTWLHCYTRKRGSSSSNPIQIPFKSQKYCESHDSINHKDSEVEVKRIVFLT